MTVDAELITLLRRIADALERIAPPRRPEPANDPDGEAFRILGRLGIREPHRTRLARQVSADQVLAWHTYVREVNFPQEHRLGYIIQRLYAGDQPPSSYETLLSRYVPLEYEDIIEH